VDLPPWLWGGDPQRLLTESELRSRSDGRNGYFVQPEESYRQQRPDLVRLRTIVKPTESLRRWKYLEHADERVVVTIPERVHQNLERRRLKAEERGALVDLVNHQVLLLHSLPLEDLREQSEYFLGTLNDIQFNEDPTRGPSATPACTSFRPISPFCTASNWRLYCCASSRTQSFEEATRRHPDWGDPRSGAISDPHQPSQVDRGTAADSHRVSNLNGPRSHSPSSAAEWCRGTREIEGCHCSQGGT
jgi:hypothetical protein